jgi:hypothetical protein
VGIWWLQATEEVEKWHLSCFLPPDLVLSPFLLAWDLLGFARTGDWGIWVPASLPSQEVRKSVPPWDLGKGSSKWIYSVSIQSPLPLGHAHPDP